MKKINFRQLIQIIFVIISIALLLYLFLKQDKVAHEYCPFASVCFGMLGLNPEVGFFIFKLTSIIGLIILLVTLFLGRIFCSYICFLGSLQEFIFNIKVLKKYRIRHIPKGLHRVLLKLKYLLLLLIMFLAYSTYQFLYMKFCPVMALAHIKTITFWGILSLSVIFIVGFFIERFWCKYLCPYAALMNVLLFVGNLLHIPRKKIAINQEFCINCNKCEKVCPMQIDLVNKKYIKNVECILCKKCIRVCKSNPKAIETKY